jgi:tungstate transport system substrate-binding protein
MATGLYKKGILRLATTTSTHDSGLLDILNTTFEERTGGKVAVHPKGTGGAIQLAVEKRADLIFVHSREEEDQFLRDGYGVNRRDVMYNDFVVVGPQEDPAEVQNSRDVLEAFLKMKKGGDRKRAVFVSRDDRSGTHNREWSVWRKAGVKPAVLAASDWYIRAQKGMGDTLRVANEHRAYTLSDRGTWLKFSAAPGNLHILLEGPLKGGDPQLMNPYGVIAVNPAYNPEASYELAMAYITFVTSLEGQRLIGSYQFNGEALFVPDAK